MLHCDDWSITLVFTFIFILKYQQANFIFLLLKILKLLPKRRGVQHAVLTNYGLFKTELLFIT